MGAIDCSINHWSHWSHHRPDSHCIPCSHLYSDSHCHAGSHCLTRSFCSPSSHRSPGSYCSPVLRAGPRRLKSQAQSKAQHKTESCFVLRLLILDESFTWHRPIFSGGYPPNIVGATAFHSRVRDGSEWFHCAMDTRIELLNVKAAMA